MGLGWPRPADVRLLDQHYASGVTHSLHLHPNSVVSGTYYVATPRGCAGLKFEDPRMSRFMASPPVSAEGGLSPVATSPTRPPLAM